MPEMASSPTNSTQTRLTKLGSTHHGFALQQVLLEGLAETRRDDRYVDLAVVLLVDDSAEDHVGGGICQARDHFRYAVDLLQREVPPAGDVVYDAGRPLNGALYEGR